ncbi:unnamed protein product [Lupinus luteus]|uniref:Uncharacterized protein n=1 Tax=Lupinus luteus TaxID=3873 RepID=A0AAV1XTX3_LUPLU
MASSDKSPDPTPARGNDPTPPGEPMTMGQHFIDKSAMMVQSLKPIKQISQHVCSFAIYSHDMSRQIETHHYCSRLNQEFLQCAVYDSDQNHARLVGDKLPLGAPSLMMSPQGVSPGLVRPDLVHERDTKYNITSESMKSSRLEIEEPEMINPMADYWKQHGKGFAIDFVETEMKVKAPFP